jgi:hypothetical protein
MTAPAPDSDAARRLRQIEVAVEGLLYSSESDRPFEPFFRPAAVVPADLDARTFSRIVDAGPDDPVEERPFHRFLERHIDTIDPADSAAWQRLPRYEALRRLLLDGLGDVRFFRIGRVQVRCFAVGRDPAGNLLGVETVAIET